jgi:hypothetical protein
MAQFDPLNMIDNPSDMDLEKIRKEFLNKLKSSHNYKEKDTFFNKLSKLSGDPFPQTKEMGVISSLNLMGNHIIDKLNSDKNQDYIDYWMRTYNTPGTLVDPNKFGDIKALKYGGQIRKTIDEITDGSHNAEVEKDELIFGSGTERNPFDDDSAIGGGLYHVKGKSHAQGGTKVKMSDGDFVFSKDPAMAIPQEVAKDITGKDIKSPSKRTPAALAKHYDALNDYIALSQDVNATELQRKTALLNVENFTKQLGQIAAAQEMLKGMPEGLPDLANQGIQTAKRGGKFIKKYGKGGGYDDNPYPWQPNDFSETVKNNKNILKYLFNYRDNLGEIEDIQSKGKNGTYGGIPPYLFHPMFLGADISNESEFKKAQRNFNTQYRAESDIISKYKLIPEDILKLLPRDQFTDAEGVSKIDGKAGKYSASRFSHQIPVPDLSFTDVRGMNLTSEQKQEIAEKLKIDIKDLDMLKLSNFITDTSITQNKDVPTTTTDKPSFGDPAKSLDKKLRTLKPNVELDNVNQSPDIQTRDYNSKVNILPNELLALYYNNKLYDKRYPTAQRAYELENIDSLLSSTNKDISYRPYLDETQRQFNNLESLGDSPQSTARQLEVFKQGLVNNNKAISDVTNINEQRKTGVIQGLAANQGAKASSRIQLQKQYINELEQLATNIENEKKGRGLNNVKLYNDYKTRSMSQRYLNAMADNFQLDADGNLKLMPGDVRKQIEMSTGASNSKIQELQALVSAFRGLAPEDVEILRTITGTRGATQAILGSN